MGLFWTSIGDDWIKRRNDWINQRLGPDPAQSMYNGSNPMDWSAEQNQAASEAHYAWKQQWDALEQQWFASLPPEEAQQAYDAFAARSADFDKSNKIGRTLALGIIGAAAGGAGLQALGGAGLSGGAGTAATVPSQALGGGTMLSGSGFTGAGMTAAEAAAAAGVGGAGAPGGISNLGGANGSWDVPGGQTPGSSNGSWDVPGATGTGSPTGGSIPGATGPAASSGGLLDLLGKGVGGMDWQDIIKYGSMAGAVGNSIFGQSDSVKPPDFMALAEKQAQVNHPNQTNAQGDTSTWEYDPATGQYSQVQKYGATNQGLFDLASQAKTNLLTQAAGQGQLSTEGMPELGGIVMDPVGSNQAITDAWLARMNPQLQRQREAELQRLAGMGITENRAGGPNMAYENAMDRLNRNEVDAANQALIYGTNAYNQSFTNSLGADAANRANQGQQFSQAQTIHNQPYNQLQMMTGTTPGNPIFGNPGTGADYYGAGQDQYAAQLAQQNAKNAASNNITQGLWGLAKSFTPTPQG